MWATTALSTWTRQTSCCRREFPTNSSRGYCRTWARTTHTHFSISGLAYQPGRERARRHLTTASQFWHAARDLVRRGGIDAACENMFAAAELATMAMMEGTNSAVRGHSARSARLQTNGPAYGLTSDESASLGRLLNARNLYRYGDATSTITPVGLLELYSHVEAVLAAAQQAITVDAS